MRSESDPGTGNAVTGLSPCLLDRALSRIAIPFAAAMSFYHLAVAFFGPPVTEAHRPTHFLLGCAIVFCLGSMTRRPRGWIASFVDLVLLCFILVPSLYLIINADTISDRMVYVDPLTLIELILGPLVIIATLEATRRLLGWPIVIIAALFLIYTQLGPHLPYPFWHRGYSPEQVIEQMYLTLDGLWGTPIGASSNYIFLFVLFGALLVASGAGAFFSEFANAIAGRYVGGPAKTAVISSALMSTLSGSSTANVVTTGSFTIPAMKRYGYKPEFAGGIEALASTGGLITPPIMGAAAFIMADFLGVAYTEIMLAAAIPALLYFTAIFIAVDLEARRLSLRGGASEERNVLRTVWKGLHMVVPLGLIVWFLIEGYTPSTAAFWAIVAFVAAMPLMARKRPLELLRVIWSACLDAPRMMAPIVVACAVGGLIAGIISLTGLGVRITSIIATVAGDSTSLFLALTMLVSIVLGMGMPTSAVYIILAAILAPGLIGLGFPPIAAHMFIFFGAVMSNITPPLAMASFAAAAVAGSNPWKTSITAVRLGIGVFIVPFIFSYAPVLLGQGDFASVLYATMTAVMGIAGLSIASIGWLGRPLPLLIRLLFVSAAVSLIVPGTVSDLFGAVLILICGGFILLGQKARQQGARS